MFKKQKKDNSSTSWENVKGWYHQAVGKEGHYYHQKVVIPGVLNLIKIKQPIILDLACGQGILARHLPPKTPYYGIDLAPSFIKLAKQQDHSPEHQYVTGDITKPFPFQKNDFTHATLILALQNIVDPLAVFKHVHKHLAEGGFFIIVLNHPCFRIPRQSSWGVDQEKKIQYRRIDSYLSPMKIPIQTHPGQKKESVTTLSFHFPLSSYSRWLSEAGFHITLLEEWCSDKVSTGACAKMENRSRTEIPLFLAILAQK